MEGLTGVTALFYVAFAVLCLVVSILAFFLPFFVLRIRNESIETNRQLRTIVSMLTKNESKNTAEPKPVTIKESKEIMITCSACGADNDFGVIRCFECGESLC